MYPYARSDNTATDGNNYRPIATATALSKVLEQVWLSLLARYLWTADSQFGFKQAHGPEMAIFALKQTVDFYRNHTCFLDAKMHLRELIIGSRKETRLYRNVPVHIA